MKIDIFDAKTAHNCPMSGQDPVNVYSCCSKHTMSIVVSIIVLVAKKSHTTIRIKESEEVF